MVSAPAWRGYVRTELPKKSVRAPRRLMLCGRGLDVKAVQGGCSKTYFNTEGADADSCWRHVAFGDSPGRSTGRLLPAPPGWATFRFRWTGFPAPRRCASLDVGGLRRGSIGRVLPRTLLRRRCNRDHPHRPAQVRPNLSGGPADETRRPITVTGGEIRNRLDTWNAWYASSIVRARPFRCGSSRKISEPLRICGELIGRRMEVGDPHPVWSGECRSVLRGAVRYERVAGATIRQFPISSVPPWRGCP
jgi:hypothetical protein